MEEPLYNPTEKESIEHNTFPVFLIIPFPKHVGGSKWLGVPKATFAVGLKHSTNDAEDLGQGLPSCGTRTINLYNAKLNFPINYAKSISVLTLIFQKMWFEDRRKFENPCSSITSASLNHDCEIKDLNRTHLHYSWKC